MRSNPARTEDQEATVAAVNQVLAAEADAARARQECEQQAREIVQQARARALRIHQRADGRIQVIHRLHDERRKYHAQELEDQKAEIRGRAEANRVTDATVASLVGALADELLKGK